MSNEKVAAFTGDMTNMETMFAVKEFFKVMGNDNIEHRNDDLFYDNNFRENYLFNSQINGIEESDLIILIGTNPRYEATIVNARIRKAFLKNKTKIFSFGNIGDITYPYTIINNNNIELKNLLEKNGKLYEKFKTSKTPMFIFGDSFFKLKSAEYLFTNTKKFLNDHENQFKKGWKSINCLSKNASSVGAKDLNITNLNYKNNVLLNKLKSGQINLLFLFGQDDLKFIKKNEFIVYIGSHGDRGAEIADIILPSPAYTEQNGYFTNLEGRMQKSFKASYPTGSAKEEWEIVNDLSKKLINKTIFENKDILLDNMHNYLKVTKKKTNQIKLDVNFFNEKIIVDDIDYYFSNVIARASKTMAECRNAKINAKKTGTDG